MNELKEFNTDYIPEMISIMLRIKSQWYDDFFLKELRFMVEET